MIEALGDMIGSRMLNNTVSGVGRIPKLSQKKVCYG